MNNQKQSSKGGTIVEQMHRESSSNEELIKYHEVKESPFTIVEDLENERLFVVIGNNRISDYYSTDDRSVEGLSDEYLTFNWDRVLQVIFATMMKIENIKDFINENKEKEDE